MANPWKKLGDKLGSSAEGPNAADWASMEKMIANQPALQAKGGISLALKAILISMGSLSLILALWFYNLDEQSTSPILEPGTTSLEETQLNSKSTESKEQSSLINSTEDTPAVNNASKALMQESLSANKPLESPKESSPANKSWSTHSIRSKDAALNLNAGEAKADANHTRNAGAFVGEQESKGTVTESKDESTRESNKDKESVSVDQSSIADNLPLSAADSDSVNVREDLSSKSEGVSDLDRPLPRKREETLATDDNQVPSTAEESPQALAKDSFAQEAKEEASKPALEEDFINPATGFKLQSVNLAFGGASNFRNPMGYGFQTAFDFQWNRNNWFFQGGLSVSQDYQTIDYKLFESQLLIDSSYALDISSRQVPVITRIWVIDSFNSGHYEIDTTFQTVIDTNIVLNLDSNEYQVSHLKTKQIRFQYAELPLLYGYQKEFGAWHISLAAGVSVQQALAVNAEDYSRSEAFSLAILVQPTVSFKLNQQWSVFARLRLQEQVLENRLFQTNQSPYSCQLGVSYHW